MNKRSVQPINNAAEIKELLEYIKTIELDDDELDRIDKFLHLEIYQQNLILMKGKGMSLREIGEEFDVSYQWVNQHLKIAYKTLNEKI